MVRVMEKGSEWDRARKSSSGIENGPWSSGCAKENRRELMTQQQLFEPTAGGSIHTTRKDEFTARPVVVMVREGKNKMSKIRRFEDPAIQCKVSFGTNDE